MLDESAAEFLRAKSLVASTKNMHEISRLSSQLEAETRRTSLLAQQYNSPADIVQSVAAYLRLSCVCFLRSEAMQWSLVTSTSVSPAPSNLGNLFEQLSFHEIYVDRKGLLSSDILQLAGLKQTTSRDMVFAPITGDCVWLFFGRESPSLVLGIEQQTQWRALLQAASALLAQALSRSLLEQSLRSKAAVGDLLQTLCRTLFQRVETVSPATVLASLPTLLLQYLLQGSESRRINCEIFLRDASFSCVDSQGMPHELRGGLVQEAFQTKSMQQCNDIKARRRDFSTDCGSLNNVATVLALHLWSREDVSAVVVFRFLGSRASEVEAQRSAGLAATVAPVLECWAAQNQSHLLGRADAFDSSLVPVLEVVSGAVQRLLAGGEKGLFDRPFLQWTAQCFDCDWVVALLRSPRGDVIIEDGTERVVSVEDLRGVLRETLRGAADERDGHSDTPTVQVHNALLSQESGLQSLILRALEPQCNMFSFSLNRHRQPVHVTILGGRSWRPLSADIIRRPATSLVEIYCSIVSTRSSQSASSSAIFSLQGAASYRASFQKTVAALKSALAETKSSTAPQFRAQVACTLRDMSGPELSASLLVYGGVRPGKWVLSGGGVWAWDKSFLLTSRRISREDCLHSYNKLAQRFIVSESVFSAVEMKVVLEVVATPSDESSSSMYAPSREEQQQLIAAHLVPLVASFIAEHHEKLFDSPAEEYNSIDALSLSPLLHRLETAPQSIAALSLGYELMKVEDDDLIAVITAMQAVCISNDGEMSDPIAPSRNLPIPLQTEVRSSLIRGRNEFTVCTDSAVVSSLLEYMSQASTGLLVEDDCLVGMHSFCSAEGAAVVFFVLYRPEVLLTTRHLQHCHVCLGARAQQQLLLTRLAPQVVSVRQLASIQEDLMSVQRVLEELRDSFRVESKAGTAAGQRAIAVSARFNVAAMTQLLRLVAEAGLHERASMLLQRVVSEELLGDVSRTRESDVAISWSHTDPSTDSTSSNATIGVVSEDIMELVRRSGRALELDFQGIGGRYKLTAAGSERLRSREARISCLPVHCEAADGVSSRVLAVVQVIGSMQPYRNEAEVLHCLCESLKIIGTHVPRTTLTLETHPLTSILHTLQSPVGDSIDYRSACVNEDFLGVFVDWCAVRCRATVALLRDDEDASQRTKAVLCGRARRWQGGGAVLIDDSISAVSRLQIQDFLDTQRSASYIILPRTVLHSGEAAAESVYMLVQRLSGAQDAPPIYLLQERSSKPTEEEIVEWRTLAEMHEFVIHADTMRHQLASLRQSQQHEAFSRRVMLSRDLEEVATLVTRDLPCALNCHSATLIPVVKSADIAVPSGVEKLLSQTALHSSRSNDDKLAALCVMNNSSPLHCRQGTLSSAMPSIFLSVLANNADSIEESKLDGRNYALKIVFTSADAYESFVASTKASDPLGKHMDRAIDAARSVQLWLIAHEREARYQRELNVSQLTKAVSAAVADLLLRMSHCIVEAVEAMALLQEDESASAMVGRDLTVEGAVRRVHSLPSLALHVADLVDGSKEGSPLHLLHAARLHWTSVSESVSGDDNWQTVQRPDEVDEALYFRMDKALLQPAQEEEEEETEYGQEQVRLVRGASPSKRNEGGRRRQWVHSRSNLSLTHLRALEENTFILTSNSDLSEGGRGEEVLWILLDRPESRSNMLLEVRLQSSVFCERATQLLTPLQRNQGVREALFAISKSSMLHDKLLLLQQVAHALCKHVLSIEAEVGELVKAQLAKRRQDKMIEVLVSCLRGFFAPKSSDMTLKASLEAVLTQLSRLPGVIEVTVECIDTLENALLFKSSAKRDAVEIDNSAMNQRPDMCFSPVGDGIPGLEQTGLNNTVLGVAAVALARRVFELNKAHKSKTIIKKLTEDSRASLSRARVLEDQMKGLESARDAALKEAEVFAEESARRFESLRLAKEEAAKAVHDRKLAATQAQHAIEENYKEHKKKKAQLMHAVSVLEGELAAARSEKQAAGLERDRAAQALSMAALKLREAHDDHEHALATIQDFKSKKNKEISSLQLQSNSLLAKLSSMENELLGTRKLYDQKRKVADELRISLVEAQTELTEMKKRLNLA